MKHKLKLIGIGMALLVVSMASCALSDGAIDGQVLDGTTGKPIPDAIVFVFWYGRSFGLVDSHSECYHAETARTDSDGKYHINAWTAGSGRFIDLIHTLAISDKVIEFNAHKARYARPNTFINGKKIILNPVKGTEDEYLSTFGADYCTDQESQKNLIPLFESLVNEGSDMPETPIQQKRLRDWIDILHDLRIENDSNHR